MANDFDSDAMLAFVSELKKQFQDLNKVLQDIGNQSGTGMKKAGDEVERFGQAVKKHAGTSIKEMNLGLKDMVGSLLGPVGLVYGITQVGKALETFAVGQMRLQNFARDAGYTATSIQKLQGAGEHMGYTIEETNKIISDFSGTVNGLHLDRQASDLWRNLDRIRDGGHEVALTIERMKTEGKDNAEIQQYAADLIVKQLRRQTDEGNRAAQALSDAFKIPISYAEQLAGAKAKIKDDDILVLTPEQRKKQEEYNDAWITMKRKFWKDLSELEQAAINSLVEADKNYREAGTASEYFGKLFGGKGDLRVRGGTEEYATDLRDPKTGLPLGAPAEDALPKGARPISFKGDELLETEKDSKKLLQDIRDAVLGTGAGGEHAGPGALGPGGTPRGGTLFRPGIRGGGGRQGEVGAGTDTAAIPANAGTPNEALAAQRKGLMDEINGNPALKEKVYSMLQSEESGVGPRTATMEALVNRTLMIQKHDPSWTIEKELKSGFYGPINRGELHTTRGASRAQSEAAVASAAAGSNIIHGRTDQGMRGDPDAMGPGRVKVPGTGGIFNYWQGKRGGHYYSHDESERFAAEQERRAIDKGLRTSSGGDLGTANVVVDFRNVPPGTKTDADLDSGVFKTLKLNRSTSQAGMAGQNTAPQNNWQAGE